MPTFWKKTSQWGKGSKTKKSNPEDKAWRAFSEYVRIRDCIRTTGTFEAARCVTCSMIYAMKETDAGHYVSRVRGFTKYSVRNVHAQCHKCNRFQQGNWIQYREFMLAFYGKDATEEIEISSNALEVKWIDWEERAETYRWYVRALHAAFANSSQFERRETVSNLMKEGTLEEFLEKIPEFVKSRKKAKKDLEKRQ